MFAVTVTFKLRQDQADAFLPLISENATISLKSEPGCRQFDVCSDPARPDEVFLYELYDDEAAFKTHLATPHFKSFDAAVTDMISGKTVLTFTKVAQ